MHKFDELTNRNSCLSRAGCNEMLFTLLARDPAAPVAIRAWIQERIRLGKNEHDDPQIREAWHCVRVMETQRRESYGEQGVIWYAPPIGVRLVNELVFHKVGHENTSAPR